MATALMLVLFINNHFKLINSRLISQTFMPPKVCHFDLAVVYPIECTICNNL